MSMPRIPWRWGAASLLACAPLAHADVLVEETGVSYPTIQEAVDNAPIGATLRVGAGTYTEAVLLDRDLTLIGDGVDQVTVEWDGAGSAVIAVDPVITASIQGMTVRSTTIGGIFADSLTNLELVDAAVSGTATLGGGLRVIGDSATLSGVVVYDAVASIDGGGVYATVDTLAITDSTFMGNSAPTGSGGALYVEGGTVSITDTAFTGNTAQLGGGVALVDVGATAMVRATFCGNTALAGGALWTGGASAGSIVNTIFDDNTTTGGAAVLLAGGPWSTVNNTLLSNDGDAVLEFGNLSTAPEVLNSLFALNVGPVAIQVGAGSDDPAISYNAFYLTGQEVFGGGLDTGNILGLDPLLTQVVLDSCENDQLWHTLESPLLDAGHPNAEYNDPDGSFNDIGAYGGPEAPAWFHADDDGDGEPWLYDCDDQDGDNFHGNVEVCDDSDNDCDDIVDEDPTDGTLWYLDYDGDTWGDGDDPGTMACERPDDHVDRSRDCDDFDPSINPDAVEDCQPVDMNCDGDLYFGAPGAPDFYPDRDEDTYGDDAGVLTVCIAPDGYTSDGGDCDDTNPYVHPDQDETACDGIDDNCSGDETDHPDTREWWPDLDEDGFGDDFAFSVLDCQDRAYHVTQAGDCDDANGARYPTNLEICDGIDNDCNLVIDDGEPTSTWWPDADGDGRGSDARSVEAFCQPGEDWIRQGGDCDDDRDDVYEGAPELCDGVDNDCDALIDLDDEDVQSTTVYEDLDGDGWGAGDPIEVCDTTGYALQAGDCRDIDPAINPGATEVAGNDIDENCDEVMDDAPSEEKHEKAEPKGCGCATQAHPWPLLWLVALPVVARRRR